MRRRYFFILPLVLILILLIGCAKQAVDIDGTQYQRPEFIETRPDNIVVSNFLYQHDLVVPVELLKKPVKPDPPLEEDPNPNPAHKYAFIIGISDYEGTQNDLQYCDDDARDWKTYLQSQGFTIQMVLDRNATADAIIDGLIWLRDNAQPGDEIAFCYSGHGNSYQGYGSCLISTDLYYITHEYIMQFIIDANTSKKMVAIDACKAGSFNRDAINGSIVATASDKSYSYDGEPWMSNGVWTYYYIETLENLGTIFNEDAIEYAETNMKEWANSYTGIRVTPKHKDLYTGKFDI